MGSRWAWLTWLPAASSPATPHDGSVASSTLAGTNTTATTGIPCPQYPSLLVTPPNTTQTMKVNTGFSQIASGRGPCGSRVVQGNPCGNHSYSPAAEPWQAESTAGRSGNEQDSADSPRPASFTIERVRLVGVFIKKGVPVWIARQHGCSPKDRFEV